MNNPYLHYPMRIAEVRVESEDRCLRTFDLEFVHEEHASAFTHKPGQFAELSIAGKGECPIGIASSPTETGMLRFTVFKAGVVTTYLHTMQPGEVLGVRGPLGNGFPMQELEGKDLLIIAGGYAVTTLRATLVWLLHPEHRKRYGRIDFVYGARTPGMLLYKDEMLQWQERDDVNMHITVDREHPGWSGMTGFVPTVVENLGPSPDNAAALICGPPPMIRFTQPVLDGLGWQPEQIFFSLENRMKCGIGICGRCNIGPHYVCKDGPVITKAHLDVLPKEF